MTNHPLPQVLEDALQAEARRQNTTVEALLQQRLAQGETVHGHIATPPVSYQRLDTERHEQRLTGMHEIIGTLPDFIYLIERGTHRVLYCNDAFARVIGKTSYRDVQGKTLDDLFPSDTVDYFKQQNDSVFETGESLRITEKIHIPELTEKEIYVDTHKIPIKNPDGTVYAVLGTSHDLTEVQEIRTKLDRRTVELESLISALPDHIFCFERDTERVLFCNDQFANFLGYDTISAIIGKNIYDLFPAESADEYTRQNQLMFMTGRPFHGIDTVTYEGRRRHFDVIKVPLMDADGNYYAYLGATRELTEVYEMRDQLAIYTEELEQMNFRLYDSEQFLEKILDGHPSLVTVINTSGEIVKVNAAWKHLAYEAQADDNLAMAIGYNYLDVCDKAAQDGVTDAGEIACGLRQIIAGEITHFTHEYDFTTPDGPRWFKLRASPIKTRDDLFVIMVHNNITDHKLVEIEIQTALDKAIELGELKSRFLSMISHEFRTPMAVIQTSIEMIHHYADRLTEDRRNAQLEKIQAQIKRLNGMIEEVTFAHQMQMGNRMLRLTPVNLNHLLTNIIDELQLVRKFRGAVTLNMHLPQEQYVLDEMIVYQTMSNLISNAMKYSDTDGQISITCKQFEQELSITVQDEGIGIHPDDIPYLFEPFHRGKNAGSVSGIGLGLSIVKQSVNLHHGDISVTSKHGEGSIFTVTLPANLEPTKTDEMS